MKTAILLVNLGTPDSPEVKDVRKYLREFLSDPRVIDISAVSRWLLVNLIIAPIRGPKSAKLYKSIWSVKGSPLLYYSVKQKEMLSKLLGSDYEVEMAMRYQTPSIETALEKFKKPIYKKIIVFPLFPQYASASTGSVLEKVMDIVSKWEIVPEINFINSFCDDKNFISTFVARGKEFDMQKHDHILFSFHGLPERQIKKGDAFNHCLNDGCCTTLTEKNAFCYRAQCFQTARKMAEALSLPADRYTVCFQSRLGKDPWIKPYSDEIIRELGKKGVKKLLVFAPAFVSDCLETIYEIGVEYDELFREFGGEKVTLVPSLNDTPAWIEAMKNIITQR